MLIVVPSLASSRPTANMTASRHRLAISGRISHRARDHPRPGPASSYQQRQMRRQRVGFGGKPKGQIVPEHETVGRCLDAGRGASAAPARVTPVRRSQNAAMKTVARGKVERMRTWLPDLCRCRPASL